MSAPMRPSPAFAKARRGVAAGMACGLAATLVCLCAGWFAPGQAAIVWPERLRLALVLQLPAAAWLAASIGHVARLRLGSPQDIEAATGGPSTPAIGSAVAIARNTAEQVLLAALASIILATTLDRPRGLLIAATVLFSLGRALFWFGYAGGAVRRALGFALTFYPSVALVIVALIAVVSNSL